MEITDFLEVGCVLVEPGWETLDDALHGMLERLVDRGHIQGVRCAEVFEAIRAREDTGTTAIVEIGISIPHAHVEGIESVVLALALSRSAVYRAAEGIPITIVALMLSPTGRETEHLQALAGLSLALQSGRLRQDLRDARSGEAVLEILRERESVF